MSDRYCRNCKGRSFVWVPVHFPGFPPRMDWLPCEVCNPVTDISGRVAGGVLGLACLIAAVCLWFRP
jgi:hypothetical protein